VSIVNEDADEVRIMIFFKSFEENKINELAVAGNK
jgi:hypothetical protein